MSDEPVKEEPTTMHPAMIAGLTAGGLAPWIAWNWEMFYLGKLLPMPDAVAATLGLLLLAVIGAVHRYVVQRS